MTTWMDELNQFFEERGKKQAKPEFDTMEEAEIQQCNENIVKPLYKKIQEQLDSYRNQKADVFTSRETTTATVEQVEFRVSKSLVLKFIYRLQFRKENGQITVSGQYCIPNFYREMGSFNNTAFTKVIGEVTEEDIANDFTSVFTAHYE